MATGKVKAIKPKQINVGAVRLELLNGLRKAGKAMQEDFEKTTTTWQNKPKFAIKISLSGGEPSVSVSTDDEIYNYVNDGTKPHIIRPVKAKSLRFTGGYRAKTQPGVIGSGSGGADGDLIFTQEVHHPGSEAREFAKTIAEEWDKGGRLREFLDPAMAKAAKKLGG